MSDTVLVQSPPAARRLFLLFHGVGAAPQDLAPLGARLARDFPDAAVVSVAAPDRSDFGTGFQWFPVRGVTEENRPPRVAATLERFLQTVREWQQATGVGPAGTVLVGFSQGAIMALAAAASATPPAARVVSMAGRFDAIPQRPLPGVRLHFLHGSADAVIPAVHAQQAARALQDLGSEVTLDVVPGLGHGIDARAADLLVARLREA